MSQIIVIDPGQSTGVALFIGPRLVATMTTTYPHTELIKLLRSYPGAAVVREEAPTIHVHQPDTVDEVVKLIEREADGRSYSVKPSQWKGSPFAALGVTDHPNGSHERDAVMLGRWYLAMRRFNALPANEATSAPVEEDERELIGPPDPDLTQAHHDALREDAGHPY